MPDVLAFEPDRACHPAGTGRSVIRSRLLRKRLRARRFRGLVALAISACVLGPMVVSSTSPTPPPFHEFHASGTLVRRDGGALANFTVVLVRGDSTGFYPILWAEPDLRPIAVTDTGGEFDVSIRLRDKPDQLALATLVPGGSVNLGEAFSPDIVIPNTVTGKHVREGTACAAHMETEVTTGYIYWFSGQVLVVD